MLSIFKKDRVDFKELFSNFTDIHSHLIPGIDDGAEDLKTSLNLINKMYGLGVRKFIFTPHIMEGVWENTPEKIESHFLQLKNGLPEALKKEISISFAAEYMLDNNFTKLLQKKKLLTVKDNYILVEMSYLNPPINLHQLLFEIQIAGYKPILAHPERYNFLHTNFREYYKLKESGCLFQINLLSLTSYYGKDVQKTALKLIKNKLADVAGSDVHHQKHIDALSSLNKPKTLQLIKPLIEGNKTLGI